MSEMWLEDLDSETAEDLDDLYDEAEDDDQDDLEWDDDDAAEDEESRARRRTRARRLVAARRRQAALARARAARRRGGVARRGSRVPVARPARAPATRPSRSTVAAIRSVDLNSKVAEDGLRRQLAAQRRRMSRSEYASVAGAAVGQFIESFQQPENAYAKAALRFAPLLLLSPQRRGSGVQAVAADPRVIGGAAVLGITFLGEQRNKATIDVASTSQLSVGQSAQFGAQVLSTDGEVQPGKSVTWFSSDPSVAEVHPSTGLVTAKKPGAVFLTVSAEGLPARRIALVVAPGDGGAGGQAPAGGTPARGGGG